MEAYVTEILFGGFLALMLLGAPITVSLAGAAMAAFLILGKNPIAFVQIAFTSVGSFPLMALPAFVLAGAMMGRRASRNAWSISPKPWPDRSPAGWAPPPCWPACSSARSRVPARPPPPRWAC
jgi:hypothetical protein